MSARRVLVPRDRIGSGHAALGDDARHYLRDVLRLAPGDGVEVFDGEGAVWQGTIEPGFGAVLLGERKDGVRRGAEIWLLFALAKGEKNDLVVQKATELGAARIAPFAAERSVVVLDAARGRERARRWRRIAEEAARQCGRAHVPEVAPPCPLREALAAVPPGFAALVFHRDGAPLASLEPAASMGYAALIGPEGGLADDELAACARMGARRASLGPRTLRAETAAIVALALLQARFGDLAPPASP